MNQDNNNDKHELNSATSVLSMVRFFAVFFLLSLFAAIRVDGQQALSMHIALSSENGSGIGITELQVQIGNEASIPFKGSIELSEPQPFRLLTRRTGEVKVVQHGNLYLPVKLFAPGNIPAGNNYRVSALLKDEQGKIVKQDTLVLSVKKVVNTTMTLLQENVVINRQNEISVPLRLLNSGNANERITVIVKYPSGFRKSSFIFPKILLRPFSDTILYYNTTVSPEMYRKGAFDIKFTGLYGDGNLIGINTAKVALAKTVHTFHAPRQGSPSYDGTSNSISVMARYIGDPLENYEIWGGSSLTLGKARIIYNVDLNVWKNQDIKPVLRNTYAAIEYGNAGIVAGSINRTYDINLFGKGVAIYLKKTRHHTIEAGYLQDGYNLLMNQEVLSLQQGWSAWVHHEYERKQFRLRTEIITNNPSYARVSNRLITTELSWMDKKSNRLQLNAGYGLVTNIDSTQDQRNGLAGGIIYSGQYKRFRLTSNNYVSSGYYPGYRRGASILSERGEWQYTNKYKLWLAYTYYSFDPKVMPGTIATYTPVSRYFSRKAEIGWDANPGGKFTCTIGANYGQEGGGYNGLLQPSDLVTIRTAHLAAILNISNPLARYFATLNVEGGGYSVSSSFDHAQPHIKANIAASYKWFQLTAFYQSGYFQASEVLSYYNTPGAYRQLTINPQLTKTFLKDRLKVDAGFAYNSSSRFPNTSQLTCALQYSITPRLSAVASYSRFNYSNMSQNILEAGFTYAMPPAYSDAFRSGRELKVFAFHDQNGNGLFDEGDDAATGQVLTMNNTPFITNSQGFAKYTRLPDTTISVRIADGEEWYARDINVHPGDTAIIALQRTSKVSGQLAYATDEYSYEIEQKLSGIALSLVGKDKVYKTRTDDRGAFSLYVPAGSYEFILDTGNLSDKVESPQQGQTIIVKASEPYIIAVKLQIKGRKVNIKKFGSQK